VKHSLSSRSDGDVLADIEALKAKVERARLAAVPPQIEATAETLSLAPVDTANEAGEASEEEAAVTIEF
jgi:hypothetical protein